jgi:hypothetical protein
MKRPKCSYIQLVKKILSPEIAPSQLEKRLELLKKKIIIVRNQAAL